MLTVLFIVGLICICIGLKWIIFGTDNIGVDGPELSGVFLVGLICIVLSLVYAFK